MRIIEHAGWKIRRDHARRWLILGAPCAPTFLTTLRAAKAQVEALERAGKVPPLALKPARGERLEIVGYE